MKLVTGLVAAVAASVFVYSAPVHAASDTSSKTNEKYVTVAAGDYLEKIAADNGSTMERMFFANTSIADPDIIHAGDKLRVPTADEQLTPREIPSNYVAPAPVAYEGNAYQSYSTPAQPQAAAPAVAGGSVWDQLAQCESGGNWSINTGNGYYGGLQFSQSSWTAAGGSGSPQNASREEQIRVAQNLQSMQGWGAWPACSSKLGLR